MATASREGRKPDREPISLGVRPFVLSLSDRGHGARPVRVPAHAGSKRDATLGVLHPPTRRGVYDEAFPRTWRVAFRLLSALRGGES